MIIKFKKSMPKTVRFNTLSVGTIFVDPNYPTDVAMKIISMPVKSIFEDTKFGKESSVANSLNFRTQDLHHMQGDTQVIAYPNAELNLNDADSEFFISKNI